MEHFERAQIEPSSVPRGWHEIGEKRMSGEKVVDSLKIVGKHKGVRYSNDDVVNSVVQIRTERGLEFCSKCRCNVFTQLADGRYICNGCGTAYEEQKKEF